MQVAVDFHIMTLLLRYQINISHDHLYSIIELLVVEYLLG